MTAFCQTMTLWTIIILWKKNFWHAVIIKKIEGDDIAMVSRRGTFILQKRVKGGMIWIIFNTFKFGTLLRHWSAYLKLSLIDVLYESIYLLKIYAITVAVQYQIYTNMNKKYQILFWSINQSLKQSIHLYQSPLGSFKF